MNLLPRRLLLLGLIASAVPFAGAAVPSPREHFGFAIGDDYHLATYAQTEAYFKKVAATSDRAKLVDIGRTEEGRTQWMMILSAPDNIRRLEHYQAIAQKLARAENLTDAEAHALAAEGKAVVWIDGGLHASETVGTHQLIETIWQLASGDDPELQRILRDVIVLCVHANPDGQELVSNWYMREPDPTKRVLTATPRLWQKYIGHDDNRDFYLSAMKETTNLNRQLYVEWYPQVVYNHHQSGPPGTIIFIPPFRDPFNYHYDPLVVAGIAALGTAIQQRFLEEGRPGATSRSGASYSTWFNGSLRTTAYFHNMIGLLTEIVGNPTPMRIPLVLKTQLPSGDLPSPVAPQLWHFRQSIDYDLAANRAVLDYAQRHRETLLYDIYRMGRNSIERGRRDEWTAYPARLEQVKRLAAADPAGTVRDDTPENPDVTFTGPARIAPKYYETLHQPAWRDPRGFIIPRDQPDFPTAVKFINALIKTGVVVQRATADFSVAGKRYPAGSLVVKTDQAFRPHVLDMFEPQDHPNDFAYEGGPPNKPYDVTGYTLALQMGVAFDRVLDGFDGPFERLPYGELQRPPAGKIEPPAAASTAAPAGFILDHRVNDSAIAVNRLLKGGGEVYWLTDAADDGRGAIYVPDRGPAREVLAQAARELGLTVRELSTAPRGAARQLHAPRIALWDRFGGSMPSGWTRWLLEQFEFPFDVVYAPQIDAGGLRERYDVIVFPTGAIPAVGGRAAGFATPANLPPEYRSWIGRITAEKSIPALRTFVEAGGSIVAIGSSTNLAYQFGLGVKDALVETTAGGKVRALPEEKFYVPGSILAAAFDTSQPIAWGLPEHSAVYFERSAAFTLEPAGAGRAVARYEGDAPLRSGWAWGQQYLANKVAVASVPVGAGQVYLMGSEIAFRGQTHATFKLLFNALYLAAARNVTLPTTPQK